MAATAPRTMGWVLLLLLQIATAAAALVPMGGPRTRLERSAARRCAVAPVCMAGFGSALPAKPRKGGKAAGGKKPPPLSAKRQWERYSDLLKGGSGTARVYACDGSVDDDEWVQIGTVAYSEEGSAQAAAQLQKRLILEHAARMYPRLSVKKASLICGWEAEGGEVTRLEKGEVPEKMSCGFVGEPDAGGFYSRGSRVEKETAASGAAPKTDSKGRISG